MTWCEELFPFAIDSELVKQIRTRIDVRDQKDDLGFQLDPSWEPYRQLSEEVMSIGV